MAITVTLTEANDYFANNVLWSDEWDKATDVTKNKALTNAENQLYRYYKQFNINDPTKQIPHNAIFEQALWLLRMDDSIRRTDLGVSQTSVKGLLVTTSRAAPYIAPEVIRILGRRSYCVVL